MHLRLKVCFAMSGLLGISLLMAPSSSATADNPAIVAAVDAAAGTVTSVTQGGDTAAIAVNSAPVVGFPTKNGSYLVMSTGDADALVGDPAGFASTDLANALSSADNHDLNRVTLHTTPPAAATCVAFDFAFLSEEYPEFVGSAYNDIFTAEMNESLFSVSNGRVVAPNNFAYDSDGNPVSINTVIGMQPVPATVMNGSTPALTASAPVEKRLDGTMDLILSIQDLGDNYYDSAVVVDNLRFGTGPACATGTTVLTDTDSDGLPDEWETDGLDIDKNGTIDLNLPAMGANPRHKDVFAEIDYMKKANTCVWLVCWGGRDFSPSQSALADVRNAFAGSPVSNPDGTTGVRMHIDAGPNSVMNPITGATWGSLSRSTTVPWVERLGSLNGSNYDWAAVENTKKTKFDLARRDVFHYVLYGDTYPTRNAQGTVTYGSSGISRGIPGSDIILTDGDSSWNGGFTRTQERGTFMHELGHGLGLRHGGDINDNPRPNYVSIMSYSYQLVGLPPNAGLDYSRGTPFNDWTHLRYDGGAIGARGQSTTLPTETTADEPTADDLKAIDKYSSAGDGVVSFVGPSLLVPGTGQANLLFDVTNVGPVSDTFTVKATSGVAAINGTVSAVAAPGAKVRLSIPVSTAALTPGTVELAAELSSTQAGAAVSTTGGELSIPDMTDPAVRQAALQALTDLAALPPGTGPDAAVAAQVNQAVTAATQPTTTYRAAVTVQGSVTNKYTTMLSTAELTPSTAKPTKITLRSATGQKNFTVTVANTTKHPLVYTGTVSFVAANGKTVTASTVAAWRADKMVLAGAWTTTTTPRQLGVFTVTLTKN